MENDPNTTDDIDPNTAATDDQDLGYIAEKLKRNLTRILMIKPDPKEDRGRSTMHSSTGLGGNDGDRKRKREKKLHQY